MNNKIIRVENLRKSYDGLEILKGVNFEVEKGSIFALLGSNGAGKTTTVRILATLQKLDEGTVTINGYNVSEEEEKIRECISLTGQFAAIDEILTGRENLELIAKLRHLDNPKKIAEEFLEKFDLIKFADRSSGTYSGGMKRRIDIAMSLIGDPKIIFLDEPSTGLDPQSRIEIWNYIKMLSEKGTTIFLTTQYLEEAEHLADKIAILNEGKIIACGSLEELKSIFPPAKKEYIEKQPTLEEIFLSITKNKEGDK